MKILIMMVSMLTLIGCLDIIAPWNGTGVRVRIVNKTSINLDGKMAICAYDSLGVSECFNFDNYVRELSSGSGTQWVSDYVVLGLPWVYRLKVDLSLNGGFIDGNDYDISSDDEGKSCDITFRTTGTFISTTGVFNTTCY